MSSSISFSSSSSSSAPHDSTLGSQDQSGEDSTQAVTSVFQSTFASRKRKPRDPEENEEEEQRAVKPEEKKPRQHTFASSSSSASSASSAAKKEIEFKVRISEEEAIAVKGLLNTIATFKEEIIQRDFYLDHPDHSFFAEGSLDQSKVLRVRISPPSSSICLKITHKGEEENDFYREELEVATSEPEKALELFHKLRYFDSKLLNKTRSVFIYEDYLITLDLIEGIGCLLEIEMQKEVEDHLECINAMEKFLKEILKITSYKKEMHGIEAYSKEKKD